MNEIRAPWTIRVFELLANGPMRRDLLISKTASAVPPSRAAAYANRRLKTRRKREGFQGVATRPRLSVADHILAAQENLVRESIRGQARLGNVVVYEAEGETWVRLLTAEEHEAREAVLAASRRASVEKAWRTRRRENPEGIQEAIQKGIRTKLANNPNALSEAAKKGWETRLAKDPKEPSATAKKGWETRRSLVA